MSTEYNTAERQFFISFLHTFPTNGNELLTALDDILNGEVRYLNPHNLWPLYNTPQRPYFVLQYIIQPPTLIKQWQSKKSIFLLI